MHSSLVCARVYFVFARVQVQRLILRWSKNRVGPSCSPEREWVSCVLKSLKVCFQEISSLLRNCQLWNTNIRKNLNSKSFNWLSILCFCVKRALAIRILSSIMKCTCNIGMLQEHVQLFFHNNQSQFITAVNYEDDPVAIFVIMLPQWSMTVVARHIECGETDIFNWNNFGLIAPMK